MSAAHANHLSGGPRRDLVALVGGFGQVARSHDCDMRPDGLPEHFVSAEDMNLVSDPFLDGFRRLVDRQSIRIRHLFYSKHHSHCPTMFLIFGAKLRRDNHALFGTRHNKELTLRRHFHPPVEYGVSSISKEPCT
jgi:hypothetical protein